MKRVPLVVGTLAVVLSLALSLPLAAKAQELGEEPLTEKQVKDMLKENKRLLAAAEKAQKRGDTVAFENNLAAFNARMNRLNEAIGAGRVDPAKAQTVLERVNEATQKHLRVLERVHQRCQERGKSCQGIERAMERSRQGNLAATEALARTRAGEQRTGRPAEVGRPSTGRPSVGGPARPSGPPTRPSGPPARPPRPPRP